MKKSTLLAVMAVLVPAVAAHTAEATPGIELHHMPVWGWAVIGLILLGVLYAIYAKTHGKPLNPLKWR